MSNIDLIAARIVKAAQRSETVIDLKAWSFTPAEICRGLDRAVDRNPTLFSLEADDFDKNDEVIYRACLQFETVDDVFNIFIGADDEVIPKSVARYLDVLDRTDREFLNGLEQGKLPTYVNKAYADDEDEDEEDEDEEDEEEEGDVPEKKEPKP